MALFLVAGNYANNSTLTDNLGAVSNVATVSLVITATNDAPVAQNDSFILIEGSSTSLDLALNDSDSENGLALSSIVIVSDPAHGALVNNNGVITYTHDGSETIADSFTYTIRDNLGAVSNVATVNLIISATNDAPVAQNDSFTLPEGSSTSMDLALNDSDSENGLDLSSITIVSAPAHGALVNNNGVITYTHDGSETTSDFFTYTIRDNLGAVSNVATVNLNITATNDAPVAQNDSFTLPEGSSTSLDLALNDNDSENGLALSSIVIVSAPAHGTVVNSAGVITYTHNGSETSVDSFTYTITDNDGMVSNVATVSLIITATNDAPVAQDDSFTLHEGTSSTLGLSLNDNDAENELDLTSITIISNPTNGIIDSINANGSVNYTHNGSLTTSDSFTYTIKDNKGISSSPVTVILTINQSTFQNPNNEDKVVEEFSYSILTEIFEGADVVTTKDQQKIEITENETNNEELKIQNILEQEIFTVIPDKPLIELSTTIETVINNDPIFSIEQALDSHRKLTTPDIKNKITPEKQLLVKNEHNPVFTYFEIDTEELNFLIEETGFSESLNTIQEQSLKTIQLEKMVIGSTTTVSASLSIGYLIWLVRGGVLLSMVLSSLPAWRMIDPLPILNNLNDSKNKNNQKNDSLETLINKGNEIVKSKLKKQQPESKKGK